MSESLEILSFLRHELVSANGCVFHKQRVISFWWVSARKTNIQALATESSLSYTNPQICYCRFDGILHCFNFVCFVYRYSMPWKERCLHLMAASDHCNDKPFSQWERSFHMKAVLALDKRFVTLAKMFATGHRPDSRDWNRLAYRKYWSTVGGCSSKEWNRWWIRKNTWP